MEEFRFHVSLTDRIDDAKERETIFGALEKLAKAYRPKELSHEAYPLYEQFRPKIPGGKRGWGAKGDLDLGLIAKLARRR